MTKYLWKFILICFVLFVFGPTANSLLLSPDGTVLNAGSGGSLQTSLGTWTFSSTSIGADKLILLNGVQAASGAAIILLVYKGQIYAVTSLCNWFLFNCTAFILFCGDPRTLPIYTSWHKHSHIVF